MICSTLASQLGVKSSSTCIVSKIFEDTSWYSVRLLALKSVKQPFSPNSEQLHMMDIFKDTVNHCIRTRLENSCSTMKRLSRLHTSN
ncbi:hypothetical protein NUZ5A_51205 [Candidatus Nitrosotenuis uzonensis]|uniref:Uncharacterized protein n=1 Tax=Candidatus Nitrosotenuis uzonensis TaxID=1407055 RepID=A0A812F9M5_9ARCH|nr:hypothetical protein NUZ5A_51205 [Candidatus Nitrosotenuis uzonensis]